MPSRWGNLAGECVPQLPSKAKSLPDGGVSMTVAPDMEALSNRPTVFDTDEWLDAWTRATIDKQRVIDPGKAPRYLLEHSPFWRGYEDDAQSGQGWDKPVLTIGSGHSLYGPPPLVHDPAAPRPPVDA